MIEGNFAKILCDSKCYASKLSLRSYTIVQSWYHPNIEWIKVHFNVCKGTNLGLGIVIHDEKR